MNFHITQSTNEDYVFTRSSGKYVAADISLYLATLTKLELFRKGVPLIHDLRLVDFGSTFREMMIAGQLPVLPPETKAPRKIALLGETGVNMTMVRTLAEMRVTEGQNVRAFDSLGEILTWTGVTRGNPVLLEEPDGWHEIIPPEATLADEQMMIIALAR